MLSCIFLFILHLCILYFTLTNRADQFLLPSFLSIGFLCIFGDGLRTGVCIGDKKLYRKDDEPEMYKQAMFYHFFGYIFSMVFLIYRVFN